MEMEYNEKLDELINLLDNYDVIKKIDILKDKITDKEINLINNYRDNPTIENKKKLYDNLVINEYLKCESELNFLIIQINNKFKRSKLVCESNKW